DKIATGSFDKTCKLWSSETGKCYHTFKGHTAEIVCLAFNPQSTLVATGSMDTTAKLWDIKTGEEALTLSMQLYGVYKGCDLDTILQTKYFASGKVYGRICLCFFGVIALHFLSCGHRRKKVHTLIGHRGEISSAQFNWDCSLIATASMDKTCRICFNAQGSRILTASSDKTACLWDPQTGQCVQVLEGHTDEIFSCAFNYEGNTII
ncbi:hypothetical protein AB205_0221900, partial [Aquarana catesbeiana]